MKNLNHPMQPIEMDKGNPRFKANSIVQFLTKDKLNWLATLAFPQEDWEQLAQLIGYSVSGFCDLSYVRPEVANAACEMCMQEEPNEKDVRILGLEEEIGKLKEKIKRITDIIEGE